MSDQGPQKRPGWEIALTETADALHFWNSDEYERLTKDTAPDVHGLAHWRPVPEPVFVSSGFLELADHALKSFEPEPLLLSDIPVPQAIMIFEDRINALPTALEHRFGIDRDTLPRHDGYDGMTIRVAEDEKSVTCNLLIKLGVHRGFRQCFTFSNGLEADHGWVAATGVKLWIGDVAPQMGMRPQVILRLLQQDNLADVEPVLAGKRTRKEAGVTPEDGYVLRVRLPRHRSNGTGASENHVEWSHRWLVGGHWRNQWYPSISANRQIYIAPYMKGPEDKPLVTRTRVFEAVA